MDASRSRPEAHAALNLDAYCERIGYDGERAPTRAVLAALQRAHAESIAFENLSPFLGQPVSLDLPALQHKLITQRRGGYCFEQNTLFWQVLVALGFEVQGLAARVRWNVPTGVVTALGHMLLRVRAEGEDYLADVGFGGLTLTAPLKLEVGREQPTPHEPFRLTRSAEVYTMEARVAGEWKPLYAFTLEAHPPADYEVWNWHTAHHPQSRFVTGLMLARPVPSARHALVNERYTYYRAGIEPETRRLTRAAEVRELLQGPFGIHLPEAPDLDARLQRLLDAASDIS
jgi:N-hydroxyarylamine O-acetyltransferase